MSRYVLLYDAHNLPKKLMLKCIRIHEGMVQHVMTANKVVVALGTVTRTTRSSRVAHYRLCFSAFLVFSEMDCE